MVQVLYKGRKRLVHVGKKGGKYVIVEGNKRYLKPKTKPAKTTKSKPAKRKPTKAKPAKKKVVKRKTKKPKTLMNYFKMSGGATHSLEFILNNNNAPTKDVQLEEPWVGENKLVHTNNPSIKIPIQIYGLDRLQEALTLSKQKLKELKRLDKKIEVPNGRLTLQEAYEKDSEFRRDLVFGIAEIRRQYEGKKIQKKWNSGNTNAQQKINQKRRQRAERIKKNPVTALPQKVQTQIAQNKPTTKREQSLMNDFLRGIDDSREVNDNFV